MRRIHAPNDHEVQRNLLRRLRLLTVCECELELVAAIESAARVARGLRDAVRRCFENANLVIRATKAKPAIGDTLKFEFARLFIFRPNVP